MKNSSAQALATVIACSIGGTAAGVEHGTLAIIQKTAANTDAAVQGSVYLGSTSPVGTIPGDPSGFTYVPTGSNRGDFNVQFTSPRANDRVAGVMLTSVAQNGRNNGLTPNAGGPNGISYGTSHAEPGAGGYYIPTHGSLGGAEGAGSEYNIDVSAAWFPHAEGWLAGHFKAAATLYSSPGLRLGREFVNAGDGTSRVDLRNLRSHGIAATSQNGVLLVTGGDNAANFAMSRANADGTFTVSLKNNNDLLGTGYINGGAAFAYVPITAAGMGQVKAVGKIQSDGGTPMKGGDFTITKLDHPGEWLLQIGGVTRDDGTLMISPEGGVAPAEASPVPNNTNNFVSYQWSADDSGWIVQSRNITSQLEDGATPDEPMFSFVYLTPGEEPVFAYENLPLPGIALTSPATGTAAVTGQVLTLASAVTVPTGVTVDKVDFYVGGQLVGSATSAPYEVPWTVDVPGYRVVEAFAYTAGGAVAGANRVAIYAHAAFGAPAVPGYSAAILDGGVEEIDELEKNPDYVPSEVTPWTTPVNTPAPLGFSAAGELPGLPAVNINGAPVPFNSGILFATNHATGSTVASRGAVDNNVIAFESEGNYALKAEDNKQGGGNPLVRPESGRFALGFFPYSDGWVGASVATDLSIVGGSSNLPPGVTISKAGTSDYLIEGLPLDGNLIAVSQGQGSDNVASIGRILNQWIVRSVDNNGNAEDDSFSFVYVPKTAPQVFSGAVADDGTLTPLNNYITATGATVVRTANGYEIQIGDGSTVNPSNTALFVSADINMGAGGDNIYSYSASGNKFVVFSHDLPGIGGGFQAGGFRFLAVPVAPVVSTTTEVFVSAQVAVAEEGVTGSDTLVLRFARLGADSSQPLTVNYTVSGTATSGEDYQALSGTMTFPAGEVVLDIPVTVLPDQEFELDETLIATVSAGTGYSAAGGAANATIRNVLHLPEVQSASFQQGVNDYFGQFGKRVGSDGTHQLETAVQQYALDGIDTAGSPDVNGIMRFDNLFGSDAGQIPVGARIMKAELVLTTAVAGNAQSPGPWVVDRLLFPVDSTTNYIQMTQGSNAGVRGLSARTPVAGFGNSEQGEVQAADVTSIVRTWAAAADPNLANLGFSIYDATTADGWNYCTSGNDDVQLRPKLVISYVTGMDTQSYSFEADKSARLVGPEPSFDGSTFEMGFIDQVTNATQEGLFHFPVEFGAAVGAVPLDERIVRAELVLNSSSPSYVGGSNDARSTGPVAVHRMLEDWTVASNYGTGGPMVGTQIAMAEKTRVAGLGNASAATFDVTGIVQAWREGNSNFGINVKPETGDGWQFFWPGSTGPNADRKPKLVIYTAKASTGSAFELWADANGVAGADPDSDADRDGIPALVEYALGLNPAAFNPLPSMQLAGGDATLSFTKSSTDPRLVYAIKSSADMVIWTDETATVNNTTEIALTLPVADARARFFRLSVTYAAN